MEPSQPSGPEMNQPVGGQEFTPIAPELTNGERANVEYQQPAKQEVHNPSSETANQNAGAPQFDASQLPHPIQPAVPAPDPVVQDDTTAQDDNPPVADDKERIETQWVNRAKDVVKNTRSDPYMQEKEVSKLQADYLKKRYGKNIKLQES